MPVVPFISLDTMELAAWNVQRGSTNRFMVTAHNVSIERRIMDIPTLSRLRREGDALDMLDVSIDLVATIL